MGGLTLQPTDFAVRAGETVGIYGPNGAGKSTLLQALAGLLPLTSGTITIKSQVLGEDLTPLAYHRRIAAVFQEPLLLRGTVSHNVGLGLALRGVSKAERKRASNRCCTSSRSPISPIAASVCCPVGRRNGRAWRGRWCSIRRCCFSTSLSRRSTSPRAGALVRELAELLRARRMATVSSPMSLRRPLSC